MRRRDGRPRPRLDRRARVAELQEARRVEPALRRHTYSSPDDPAAYAALARYLTTRGELEAARAQWEVVLELKPNDHTVREALARLERILNVL